MIRTRGDSSPASVLASRELQVAVAQQSEGHPEVIVRRSAPNGEIIAKIPNGTLVSLSGASVSNYLEVSVEKDHEMVHGWVKKPNLRAAVTGSLQETQAAPAMVEHSALAGPPLQLEELPEDFVSKTTRQVDKNDFQRRFSPVCMLGYLLQTQCVCLLSGRWLVEQFNKGVRFLPRRQEMPGAAYWTVSDLFKAKFTMPCSGHSMLIALSYGWIQRGHPDREAWHLSQVVSFLTHLFHSTGVNDVALFWDFYSLEQLPRTATGNLRFKTALKFMNVIYGHSLSHILRLNDLPPGITKTCERGWPFFEEAVFSTAGKKPLISIYVCDNRELLVSAADPGGAQSTALLEGLLAARNVPMSPCCFIRQLQDKKFTGNGDREEVEKMYTDNFEMMKLAEHLILQTVWTTAKAHQFAQVLCHYKNCRTLTILGTGCDDECCAELVKGLTDHMQIEQVDKSRRPYFQFIFNAAGPSSEAWKAVMDAAERLSRVLEEQK